MPGFGFGAGRRRQRFAPAGSAPVVAPGYLNTGTTVPYAVWGAHRLVSGYSGNLFTLRRASDGASLDVAAQAGGDYPDYAAITAWAAGSALTVTTLFDQMGNGRSLAQASVANQPSFDPAQIDGNAAPILFDGYSRSTNAFLVAQSKTMFLDGLALERNTFSEFLVATPKASGNGMGFHAGTENGGFASNIHEVYLQSNNLAVKNNTTSGSTVNGGMRANKALIGHSTSPTAYYFWNRESIRGVGGTIIAGTIGRFTLGNVVFAVGTGMFRFFGLAIYNSALSNTTTGPAVVTALQTACGVQTAFDYTCVFSGDSIMEGSGASLLRNTPWYMGLRKEGEVINYAVHGSVMDYSTRTKYATLYQAGRPSVIFIQGGTNDLGGGTTGANLYANSAAPFITYLKGLGYKVVLCTILPRTGSSGWTGAMETQRLAYNDLVRTNSAGADLVLDLASDSVMGPTAACADTSLYGDALHPANGGHAVLGPLYKAALQTVLRTTALGGSYVP